MGKSNLIHRCGSCTTRGSHQSIIIGSWVSFVSSRVVSRDHCSSFSIFKDGSINIRTDGRVAYAWIRSTARSLFFDGAMHSNFSCTNRPHSLRAKTTAWFSLGYLGVSIGSELVFVTISRLSTIEASQPFNYREHQCAVQ